MVSSGPFAVKIGGVTYDRFTAASVDMSIESVGFTFSGNVFVPYDQPFMFERFAECEVYCEGQRMFTARLEQPIDGYSEGSGSNTQLNGGSKTMGLALSAVGFKQRSFKDESAMDIATALAKPHGIKVEFAKTPAGILSPGIMGDGNEKFRHFRVDAGATVVDAIANVCSERSLLCYTEDGEKLLIGRPEAGPEEFTLPSRNRLLNSASIGGDSTQIGSSYTVMGGGTLKGSAKRSYTLNNPNVTLIRPLIVTATRGKRPAELEAQAKRIIRAREGRALNARARVAFWKDERGKIYRPGTLVRLKDTRLRLGPMKYVNEVLVVSDVSLAMTEQGKWADLTLKRIDSYIEE